MKVCEAEGPVLDWMVATCEGWEIVWDAETARPWCHQQERIGQFLAPYSTDWAQGGPIIERGKIGLIPPPIDNPIWGAGRYHEKDPQWGDTPLIAAMRCYVSSKLGDEVEVPEELLRT